MAQFYDTDSLIESIKRRAFIPENQNTFTDDDFIALINEEMYIGMVPDVLRLHEDYYLTYNDVPLVASQSEYEIPERAIGNKLRDVFYLMSDSSSEQIYNMTRIDVEDIADWGELNVNNNIYAYYIKNNKIRLVPNIGSSVSGYIRMFFYQRPNEMVSTDQAAIIQSINTTTGEVTVDSIPSTFNLTQTYDIIHVNSPHNIIQKEISSSAINSSTLVITFDPDDLDDVAVNDRICIKKTTTIPQLPSELHAVLAHRVAMRCLEAMGDTQGLQNASTKLKEMEDRTTNIIDNRVEGSPKKIVNRHGLLQSGLGRRFNK